MSVQPENALTTTPASINLPVLAGEVNIAEMQEVFAANLEGLTTTFQFEKIKMPSGGGLAFTIPTDEKPIAASTIKGVIIDHYGVKAYWKEAFTGENNPPNCASMDGINGTLRNEDDTVSAKTISCATCPYNQFGSGIKVNAKGEKVATKGKACKDIHRIYMLSEGMILPYLIPLPPTSKGTIRDYMKKLTARFKPFYAVVTEISLITDKNDDGIEYSKAVMAKVADLTPQEAAEMKKYSAVLKPVMRAAAIDSSEYEVHEPSATAEAAATTMGQTVLVDDSEPY